MEKLHFLILFYMWSLNFKSQNYLEESLFTLIQQEYWKFLCVNGSHMEEDCSKQKRRVRVSQMGSEQAALEKEDTRKGQVRLAQSWLPVGGLSKLALGTARSPSSWDAPQGTNSATTLQLEEHLTKLHLTIYKAKRSHWFKGNSKKQSGTESQWLFGIHARPEWQWKGPVAEFPQGAVWTPDGLSWGLRPALGQICRKIPMWKAWLLSPVLYPLTPSSCFPLVNTMETLGKGDP